MNRLTPKSNPQTDLVLEAGGKNTVVWFLDYASTSTHRLVRLFERSLDRFEALGLTLIVRLAPRPHHEYADYAARAVVAAQLQGRFAEMHETLLNELPPEMIREEIRDAAMRIGLDMARFDRDVESDAVREKLERDLRSAQASARVPHVPMFFINGVLYEGVWDDQAIIEAIERPLGVRIHIASTSFLRWAASAGTVLIVATVLALLVVNLGGADWYERLRETEAGLSFGDWSFHLPLELWVNDGLMAFFFLVVGIEIKRELVSGELSHPSKAALPLFGALGGMLMPALIYAAVNWHQDTLGGWGVPMATDIAFTLGILAILGHRVPTSLKVFVSALAIADDLGAIVVIALFYGHGFHTGAFLIAVAIFAVMLFLNRARVYASTPYLILAVFLWYFTFQSGIHATVAGVLTAIAVPSRPSAQIEGAALQAGTIFRNQIEEDEEPAPWAVAQLEKIVDRLRDPGFHLQHVFENWNSYLILPLFAFFNTGIVLVGTGFSPVAPANLGTILGLVLGKPLGILLFVWLAVYVLKVARMSPEITLMQLIGASALCGIGFTMSIFIASSYFEGAALSSVKLSVLIASVLAACIGTAILLASKRVHSVAHGEAGATEASKA